MSKTAGTAFDRALSQQVDILCEQCPHVDPVYLIKLVPGSLTAGMGHRLALAAEILSESIGNAYLHSQASAMSITVQEILAVFDHTDAIQDRLSIPADKLKTLYNKGARILNDAPVRTYIESVDPSLYYGFVP